MARTTYETVSATRPRIRRDVLFTETPDGVLFHNADGGFRLTAKSAYRFATLIVPHLTGDHTVAELCTGLGDTQRRMVGELVKTLYERDFARPVPARPEDREPVLPEDVARRYAPQIAYADHYADEAEERFRVFRDTPVAVLGDDETARWCVLSLIRNGCAAVGVLPGLDTGQAEAEAAEATADGCPARISRLPGTPEGPLDWAALDGYRAVVVTGGGQSAPARLLPLLRAGIPEGRLLLPAWTYGSYAVVGPQTRAGRAGCWACAALRLGAGATEGGAGAAAGLWSALALPGAGLPGGAEPAGPLAAMLGNLLGYEVFRAASGALPAETAGQILVQDLESLDVTAEPLLPHPGCPFCAESRAEGRPEGRPAGHIADGAEAGPAEAAAPVDLSAAGTSGAPALPTLDTARDADALVEELNRRAVLVRPHAGVFTRYADEPLTQIPLKLSVVELGIGHTGRRAVAAFDVHHVAGARMRALDEAAIVYAEHVAPARGLVTPGPGSGRAAAVLAVASGAVGTPTAHQQGVSLLTKEPVLVPAGAVRPFGPHNAAGLFERSRAGAGAGPSRADAAAAGLRSALAHDALLRAVRGAEARPVHLAAETDPEITFLVRSAERLDLPVELLDLGEAAHSGLHVLLARSGGRWAAGSDPDRQVAAVAALRDLLGAVQYERDEAAGGTPADTGDPLLRDLDARTLTTSPGAAAELSGAPVPAWPEVLERLRSAGRDAYAVPTGSADLAQAGIHTVRVLLTAAQEPGHDA
ncbi:TOMM precursor leader peptide-binding protein [Streptomyces sp. NPDC051211]|uniref:TOMM precursor leader peptide-binding protein n=1 Tax=Streptomyces sp. NPDC051211 TaxID=3154643 RepID=UPI00344E1AFF